MRLYEKRRRRRRRRRLVISSIFAILAVGLTFLLAVGAETQYEAPGEPTEQPRELTVTAPEQKPVQAARKEPEKREETQRPEKIETPAEKPEGPEFSYSKDWDEGDAYLLAKIAMAEAEGETVRGKELVILVVLNRVWSNDFPDTIREVIFQKKQFSPIANGRFDRVEPDADCWEAVRLVQEAKYDFSGGALYFESCENADNWHSRNLEFLYQYGKHKFYK